MPQFEYPYLAQPYMDLSGKVVEEFRPYVPVSISKGRKSTYPVHALIDSGADFNLFPASFAEILGLDLKKGKLRQLYGVGDHKINSYTLSVKMTVASYTFDTLIDFSENQYVPLLGRSGFFDKFQIVVFNQKKKVAQFRY